MDWAGWAVFGIAATVTLTGIMVAAQLAGLSRMDIPLILGTMFTDNPDRARSVGFLVHVVNGQVFALGYAAAFAILGRAEWWIGALFGAWHGLAALVVIVPLASGVHPRMATNRSGPELHAVLEPPGLLALNYGRETPLVALVAHVTFGVILGTFLSP
jgi:uncharacterized membrane protein YagU involved in acid resistance